MKQMMIFAVAVALFLSCAAGAHAQDADWRAGLYIKGAGGWNKSRDQSYTGGETKLKSNYAVSGAVGYDYGDWRTEVEVAYRRNDADTHYNVFNVELPEPDGDISSTAAMVNVYYDIPHSARLRFTPYVGGGIGLARVNINNYSTAGTSFADQSNDVFAYQGIAGAQYDLTDDLDVFAEYKYFATEDIDMGGNVDTNYSNHSVSAGLRLNFY